MLTPAGAGGGEESRWHQWLHFFHWPQLSLAGAKRNVVARMPLLGDRSLVVPAIWFSFGEWHFVTQIWLSGSSNVNISASVTLDQSHTWAKLVKVRFCF